ncbi:MAG: hypothetical protein ACLR1V_00065 [Coprococcus sp.]
MTKALTGKCYHGELQKHSQKLGLGVIGHMRNRMDEESRKDRPELHICRVEHRQRA